MYGVYCMYGVCIYKDDNIHKVEDTKIKIYHADKRTLKSIVLLKFNIEIKEYYLKRSLYSLNLDISYRNSNVKSQDLIIEILLHNFKIWLQESRKNLIAK